MSSAPHECDVFTAALELEPDQRSAFLDEACGTDADLRARVEDLLRHHQQAAGFLETPAGPLQAVTGTVIEGVPPSAEAVNLDFLAPADDPAVLGRDFEILGLADRLNDSLRQGELVLRREFGEHDRGSKEIRNPCILAANDNGRR